MEFNKFNHASQFKNNLKKIALLNNRYVKHFVNDFSKIIKKVNDSNKKNILYVTILDENNSVPLIDSLDKLLDKVNIFVITYSNLKIKLWSYESENFLLLKEIEFNNKIPNFNQLNHFYKDIFDNIDIDKLFFRHFGSYGEMSYFRSIIDTPRITPLSFASDKKIPVIYGENSEVLLRKLNFKYLDTININPKLEKGVVFTAIFGDYEDLLDPKVIDENLDYVCFTDNPNLKSEVWDIKLISDISRDFDISYNEINFVDLDFTRRARAIKILPHIFLKDYDFSFWVDAGFLITGNIIEYVNRYTEKDFLGVKHSVRNCLYDEAEEVIRLNIDDENIILKQIEKYKTNGFPKNNGLIESGLLFRRHNNPKIIEVMDDWFGEILNFSKRDQISFNYVAWKNKLVFDLSDIYCTRNPYFHHYFHSIKTINNKALLKYIRVILVDNGTLSELNESIDEICKINDFIPISIVTNNKNISENITKSLYNIEIIFTNENISSEVMDTIVCGKNEANIHILNAGEMLNYNIILKNI